MWHLWFESHNACSGNRINGLVEQMVTNELTGWVVNGWKWDIVNKGVSGKLKQWIYEYPICKVEQNNSWKKGTFKLLTVKQRWLDIVQVYITFHNIFNKKASSRKVEVAWIQSKNTWFPSGPQLAENLPGNKENWDEIKLKIRC